jgi:hypothetical protein
MQEAEDIVVLMFHEATEALISVIELGLAVRTKSVIICAHPDYRKRANVDAVCCKFGTKMLSTLDELVDCLITRSDRRLESPNPMGCYLW